MRKAILSTGAFLVLVAAALNGGPARAAVTTYTDSVAFGAAVAGSSGLATLDFESVAAGTTIPSGGSAGGITFNQAIGFDLLVDSTPVSGLTTTSGNNYLGLDDGFQFQFLGGDSFTMDFGATIQAVGLFVVGVPFANFAGDFTLTTSAGSSVSNAGTPEFQTAPPEGDVFFVGIVDTGGFQTATLSSFFDPLGDYVFIVDDITTAATVPVNVPEPGVLSLLAFGLIGMAFTCRRRRNKYGVAALHSSN